MKDLYAEYGQLMIQDELLHARIDAVKRKIEQGLLQQQMTQSPSTEATTSEKESDK